MISTKAVAAHRTLASFVSSGLVMWLDASDTSTMTLTGTRVDEWRDKQGSGNKVATSTGGTSFNPTRVSSLFGSRGGVRFVSPGRYLETASAFTTMNWTTGFTVFAALQKTARAGYYAAGDRGRVGICGNSKAERRGTSGAALNKYGIPRNTSVVIGTRADNTTANMRYIYDGKLFLPDDGTPQVFSGAFNQLGVGGIIGTTGFYIGDVAGYFFYNRKLTDTEIVQMNAWIKTNYGFTSVPTPTWNVIVDGNSLSIGYSGTDSHGIYDGFLAANGSPTGIDCILVGNNGLKTTDLTSRFSTTVTPLINSSITAIKRIYIVWELSNDIALNASRTGAQAAANLQTLVQTAVAAGLKVIVVTATPRIAATNSFNVNTNYEAERLAANTIVRSDAVSVWGASAVADVGGDATIGATNAMNNTTYYQSDKVHLKDAGFDIVKGYITTAINTTTGL